MMDIFTEYQFLYTRKMMRCGVNFGGWFIPERWMTPELFSTFAIQDTITLIHTEAGKKRYLKHIDEFISEDDFKWCKQNKVNLVRLPVAWWMFSDKLADVALSCIKQLDWAMETAEKYNIQILLDYHGALGSQNGKDHSGQAGAVKWKAYFSENLQIITTLANRYSSSTSLWGLELLNEPVTLHNYWSLLRFYRKAATQLKTILPEHTRIVFHDGFHPLVFAGSLWGKRVCMDMHLYEIPVRSGESLESYLDRRDRRYRRRIRLFSFVHPIIVGEWSGVLPEALLKSRTHHERQVAISQNISRQQRIYGDALVAIFWSYRTKDQTTWNARALVDNGVLLP